MAVSNQAAFAEFPKCVINIYARFFQNASCKLLDMNDLVNIISFIFAKKGIWITTMLYFLYIFMGVIKLRYIRFDSCADDKQYQSPSPQSIKRIIDKLMVWTEQYTVMYWLNNNVVYFIWKCWLRSFSLFTRTVNCGTVSSSGNISVVNCYNHRIACVLMQVWLLS